MWHGKAGTMFEVTRVDGMIITPYDGPLLFSVFTKECDREPHEGHQVREG